MYLHILLILYYSTKNKDQDLFSATRSGKRTDVKSESKDEERDGMGEKYGHEMKGELSVHAAYTDWFLPPTVAC